MFAKDKLIIALDVLDKGRCFELVDELAEDVDIFKIGIAPFTGFGEELLDYLGKIGKKVFLDLKFHDIPNTVKNAACVAAGKNIFMMNFHCSGGFEMLRAAVDGVKSAAGAKRPILLGVTVLTSMDNGDIESIGMKGTVEDKVMEFAAIARQAGMDGVVASAHEIKRIKKEAGKDFLVVTPGIRPEWARGGDQKRVLTPKEAVEHGADYIVVGRPVIQAENPGEAARCVLEEMEDSC